MRAWRILLAGLGICLTILAIRWTLHLTGSARPPVASRIAPGPAGAPESEDAARRRVSRTVPDAKLINHHGQTFRLKDLHDKIVVLSFIYTNCNMPSMCPLTTAQLTETHDAVQRRGLRDVQFVVVSFDTGRDDPDELRRFAARYELDDHAFWFATGSSEEIRGLSEALGTYYRPGRDGVFDHNLVASLVDRNGVVREEFYGTRWTPEELAAAIEALSGVHGGEG